MKKTLFLLLALLLLLLPGCKHRQPAPTDIQVLRQGSLAPADDDTTPVVYVSVRDQSRHVFGLRAEVERLLRAEKYDITDNPSQAGFIIQASVLEAGITDAASAHRMVEGGYGAPSELSGKGATLVLSDILLVQRRVPSDKRPKRFMLQNVGSRNARGSSQMRTGLLAHREFSVDSGIPALFVTLLAREITSPFSTAPQEQAPAQPQDERRPCRRWPAALTLVRPGTFRRGGAIFCVRPATDDPCVPDGRRVWTACRGTAASPVPCRAAAFPAGPFPIPAPVWTSAPSSARKLPPSACPAPRESSPSARKLSCVWMLLSSI